MQPKRERLFANLKSRAFAVPVLAGWGVFFAAISYQPARYNHRGFYSVATVEPVPIGIGVALLVAALMLYLRRD